MSYWINGGAWITATIANSAATTGEIDLGGPADYMEVDLPALDSCTIALTAATTSGGTFKGVGVNSPTTTTTTGTKQDTLLVGGKQFIKVITSVNQTAERTLQVRGFRT